MLNLGATAGAGAFPFFAEAESKNSLSKPGFDTSPSFRSDARHSISNGLPGETYPLSALRLLIFGA